MASSTAASSRLISKHTKSLFIYGTAWKKDHTTRLVKQALVAGFRSVDTAAQPRHYQENLVGQALREAYEEGIVKREDIYVQTKYTAPMGQDVNNMPYCPLDPLETQIRASVTSSLNNLRHKEGSEEDSFINCLLLHSPLPTIEETLQAWKTLEAYVPNKVGALGVSNVTLPILEAIYEHSNVKPSVVQNRFYQATSYDVPLRSFCLEHDIMYQSFWTLTGNPKLLRSQPVNTLGESAKVNKAIALYALVMDLDIVVLNGTTSTQHMGEDLAGIDKVRQWAKQSENETEWNQIRAEFTKHIKP
ncbi:aldo-keto reductase-like protein [Lindgomyces ingoldianus]|uniref:Aldo-keto reductase-like protein n=1 Tax=Lindgomyces ingoldianus TaxID=673940 RepID=A0ACB6R028_9PLEO|nr:aldo-keto reductase-like protein [Lindgomyces ingoldianus]KAF2472496.1 aldo-keto reductase-like protein [Lindgomyces ingoldianus]